MRLPWKIALTLLCVLLVGFEWEGRLNRLEHELATGDAARRREVVRLLASYPAGAVHDTLLRALGDPDAGVRAEAAEAVGRVQLRDAVPRLLDWLDDTDADVRANAAVALGRIGAARAVPPLVRLLGDARPDVRRAAVGALQAIGTPAVVVPLLGRLDDTDTQVRVAAAEALGRLGDPQAAVPLVGRLRDDAPEVRRAIYTALGQLGSRQGIAGLLQGLMDPDDEARLTAMAALGRVGATEAVPPLVALTDDADTRVARAAVAALGGIGGDAALSAVVRGLGRPETRQTAESVLLQAVRKPTAHTGAADADAGAVVARLADALDHATSILHATAIAETLTRVAPFAPIEAATPALLRALETQRGTRDSIMQALGATGDPDALVPLLERLRANDPAVQRAALAGLSVLLARIPPDGRAADPLLAALGSVPADLRPTVARLLGRVRAARAVPALRDLLDADDPRLRLASLQALGRIGDAQGAEALLPLLSDPDGRTRFEAARALGTTATEASVRALLEELDARGPRDRQAVLLALGGSLAHLRAGGSVPAALADQARTALEPILTGRDRELAARAVEALATWGAPANAELLGAVAEDAPPALRRQALRGLGAVPGDAALSQLRRVADRAHDTSLRTAAAGALGEHGSAQDVPRLLRVLRDGRWPAPPAAAFSLARLARRGQLDGSPTTPALCTLARTSPDPYVRANLAVILASRDGALCADGPDPAAWLDARHAPAVRAAAAHWLAAQAAHGHHDGDRATEALEACATDDPSAAVARACAEPALPPLDAVADVYAYAADGSSLLRDRLVGLRLADGSVLITYADLDGHVRLPGAPSGPLVLEDPVSIPLER